MCPRGSVGPELIGPRLKTPCPSCPWKILDDMKYMRMDGNAITLTA